MSNGKSSGAMSAQTMVMYAIFTAIVVILQYLGSFIRVGPFSITLVLVPIVVGAAICGKGAGAWLGLVFGAVVLITDSAAFMAVSPVGTILTVLVKGALAGLCAGAVYGVLKNKNKYIAVALAALACPVVNTGVFLVGCKLFFMETITQWGVSLGFDSAASYIIYGMVGVNFLIEIAVNMVLSPIIVRLIKIRAV